MIASRFSSSFQFATICLIKANVAFLPLNSSDVFSKQFGIFLLFGLRAQADIT